MAKIVHVTPSVQSGVGVATLLWVGGLLALLLWSLGAWLVGLLFSGSGEFLQQQAAAWATYHPEVELVVSTGTAWMGHFGTAALWILWALGALLIIFGTWLAVQGLRALQRGMQRVAPHASSAWDGVRRRIEARDEGRRHGAGAGAPTSPV